MNALQRENIVPVRLQVRGVRTYCLELQAAMHTRLERTSAEEARKGRADALHPPRQRLFSAVAPFCLTSRQVLRVLRALVEEGIAHTRRALERRVLDFIAYQPRR